MRIYIHNEFNADLNFAVYLRCNLTAIMCVLYRSCVWAYGTVFTHKYKI